MNWPTSQDYNEAIQNAASSFSDPALKSGEVAVNAIGLPVPRSGNFADVYQFKGGDGKMWAVKCFTRKVAGLQERYAKIDEHIAKANFPFTVGFKYFVQGVRIRSEWFPLLKMEWVEGFTLNEFVRDNASKPHYLHALTQMWAKLCARLRDGNFAHADLQHGNVLLVAGEGQNKLGLKLIDYDGMWVPALADIHSGEIGHPNFQHPLRLKDRLYNGDVDRFPHLVIACALRATVLGGRALWDKFDNGDNLLFKEADLRDPANAPVFKALWNLHDDVLCVLVGKIALASKEPLRRTPWLDDLLLTEEGKKLRDDEEAKVIEMLGVAPHFTALKALAAPVPAQNEFNEFAFEEDEAAAPPAKTAPNKARSDRDAPRLKKKEGAANAKTKLPLFIGGGVAAALLLIVGIIVATSGEKEKAGQQPGKPEVAMAEPKDLHPSAKAVIAAPKKDNETKVDPPSPKKKVEPLPKTEPEVARPDNNPAVAKKDSTDISGGDRDPEFREATDAGRLVGLEVGVGQYGGIVCIRTLKPIFLDGDKETTGKQWGRDKISVIKAIARPGYAVGGLNVKSARFAEGFSIIFMKIVDGKLDPRDSYESEWMGGMGGDPKATLGGDGRPVVGGRRPDGPPRQCQRHWPGAEAGREREVN